MQRREFLQSSASAAAALALPTSLPFSFHSESSAAKRKVGLIGAGWFGKLDLLHLMQVEPVEVVSICDVDSNMLAAALDVVADRQISKARPAGYSDYRKQLSELEHDLVIVGTPDHWHALPSIAAMEAGANVYCQKPTACDVLESKAMLDTARRLNKKLQIGTQRRRIPHLQKAKKEVVEAGLLGDIAMVEMCCYYHMRNGKTIEQAPDKPAPDFLDYEMWTGPAPMRPYNDIVHPKGWRSFMEYGNGIVGDMCVHIFDMTRWMLDLGWPKSISSTGGIYVDTEARANITDTQNVTYKYDDMELVWTHRMWGDAPDPDYTWAAKIYGSKGTLKVDFSKFEFDPRDGGDKITGNISPDFENYPQDEKDREGAGSILNLDVIGALGSRDLMRNWLKAIDTDSRPIADIEEGHISSASCILANMAMNLGRTLHWDPTTHTIVGDEEANGLLKRPYRDPWKHPAG